MDVATKAGYNRLMEAIDGNYRLLENFRENRISAIRQYVGRHYGKNGANDRVPLNLLELMVQIYVSRLAPDNPKSNVSSKYADLKRQCDNLELALNHLFGEIDLGGTLRMVITDSLFGIGIVKIGLNYSDTVEIGGEFHDVGQPFCDYVDLDDLVFDMSARSWEEVTFIGDKVVMTREQLLDAGLFDKDVVEKLTKKGVELDRDKKAKNISAKDADRVRNIYDFYELWNVYLPLEKKVVVVSTDVQEPLRIADWEGPEGGPYKFLYYNDVPGNLLPLSPIAALQDLHEITNIIYRQLGRQAQRQKTIMMATGGAQSDAERVMTATDGDVVRVDDPNKLREVRFNGPDAQNMGFALQARNYFSYFAGNLDSIGGLGAVADTARQESLIAESSSFRLKAMSEKVKKFIGAVMRDLGWYLFTDPFIDLPVVKRVESIGLEIERRVTADDMEGDFLDYNISMSPYDGGEPTPQEKVNAIMEYINYLAPYAPLLQSQGVAIDFTALSDMIAKFRNINELRDVIRYEDIIPEQPFGEPPSKYQTPIKPEPLGGRKYEHTYESQASTRGTEAQLAQLAMGQGMQEGQAMTMAGGA